MVVILANVENIQKNCKKKIKTKHCINFLLMEASLNGKNPFPPPPTVDQQRKTICRFLRNKNNLLEMLHQCQ